MLRDIIKKEILDNVISPKFVYTYLICTILILLSVYMGVSNYVEEKKEYAENVALNKQDVEQKTQYIEVLENLVIYRPPQALGTVVQGIEGAVGGAVRMPKVLTDPKLIDSKYGSNPVLVVFGAMDLMFIVKIVLSLFAILFTYDAIVGEKENGTLKLTLANHVPRDRLILGKAIGGFLTMFLSLLVPILMSFLILLIVPGLALSSAEWVRLFLILFMFFLYMTVFFSLGLFVSARTLRSSNSFLILLSIWVVFAMVIPKVAVVTAGLIKPVPSVHEITAKKNALASQSAQESMNDMLDYIRKNGALMVKDQKAFQEGLKKYQEETSRERTRRVAEKTEALEKDYQLKKREQQDLAVNLSRISPASAMTFGTMSLARTGVDECDRFLASIASYKQVFFEWYFSKENTDPGENRPKIELSDMPRHTFEPENLRDSMARALPDFLLMISMIIVFSIGAYLSFLRYDVR